MPLLSLLFVIIIDLSSDIEFLFSELKSRTQLSTLNKTSITANDNFQILLCSNTAVPCARIYNHILYIIRIGIYYYCRIMPPYR